MKRIFIFPSIDEAKGFILTEPRDPVFVAGVGMAETAAAVVRAVKAKKPQLAILCGLAETFDVQALPIGQVVEVVTEQIAGLPNEYETTAPDTGLPVAAGVTYNYAGPDRGSSKDSPHIFLSKSVEKDAQEQETADELPLVGNAEGAAFFAVCEALGIAGCEIRAIASRAGEEPRAEDVQQAIQNLTEILTQNFRNND